ncbi:putative response regulatory protein [Paenibacillus polymyxa E681]|uniref:response regulator transcription factor n=1 Tax=Paenibacillus polymyxa TaxID=1406 RepID=UPI0001E31189|nr:response regulator [Paenibacillus polymyxa]ADM69487.1 chemotaxis protein CheY [Paenibacillus polymyxa E681]QNV56502.1 putative response regulatory protein [Paenibacillus polymyxa E681]QNV61339.1 putative response regulatory protein [Paenibacillus polymyxa E681]
MMNVLLVDDEPWVLEGLRTIVNWDKYGFRVCGEASNGSSAWSLIERLQPELVFTDIQIPSVSGLELINRSQHKLAKPPRFVVLSGYNNFEYAVSALDQRVDDYLLKPINKDEIEAVLDQVSRKIQEETAQEELRRRDRSLYVNSLLNRLIQGEVGIELENEAATLLNIGSGEEISCLLIDTEMNEEELKRQIPELAGLELPELFTDPEGRVVMIASGKQHATEQLVALGRRLCEEWPGEAPVPAIAALGCGQGGASALRSIYEKALAALKWKRYWNEGGIIACNELPKSECMKEVNKAALDSLIERLSSDHLEEIEAAADVLLAAPSFGLPDIEYVRIQLSALEMGISKKLKELGGDGDAFMRGIQGELGTLTETTSFPDFRRYALALCLSGAAALCEQRERSECRTIFRVVQHVDQKFREKLQLQELAQLFHINPIYMGQLFKQQTGKSFRKYLNDKRIEEAKRLLRQGRLSIAEVAANSGYPNTDYFKIQFKRITGMAPSAFRRRE